MVDAIRFSHQVTVTATLCLDEEQLAALNALACYSDEAFLAAFYANIGRSYLQPHEKGLRSLFALIREVTPSALGDARKAREILFANAEAVRRKRLSPPSFLGETK